jgi:glutathione S-transferase
MLHLYGSPFSSPTNKIRYVLQYLNIPYEFHSVNLAAGEHRTADFLKLNPYGKIPVMNDNGFMLSESNAIIRYLADKAQSPIYPKDLQQRALVDQWIDYASQHVMTALSRIMFNTYFYKMAGGTVDERSLEDGRKFIAQYLPIVEQRLAQSTYLAGSTLTLADFVMLASLDTCEMSHVELSPYTHLVSWRNNLMSEPFYQSCHISYTDTFKKILARVS